MTRLEVTTWRDLADELTPDQIDDFIHRETLFNPGPDREALFVEQARKHVEGNRIDRERFGHLPPPAGARRVWHWEVDTTNGGWFREFQGREWTIEAGWNHLLNKPVLVSLFVQGRQFPDGTVRAEVGMDAATAVLGADELRRLVEVTCEALADLEQFGA